MQDRPPDMPPIDIEGSYVQTFPEDIQPPKPSWLRKFVAEAVQTVILAILLFLVINSVSARIRVDGQSMEPTFHHGNFVIVNKLAYRLGEYQYGDVIVFPSPDNHEEDLIKRVIALPGDRIRITKNQVFINDFLMSEPYIKAPPIGDLREVTVPPGAVYVMGDNRNNSSDSRRWGPLQTDDVLGKAVFVYWPFKDFGLVQQFEFIFGG